MKFEKPGFMPRRGETNPDWWERIKRENPGQEYVILEQRVQYESARKRLVSLRKATAQDD